MSFNFVQSPDRRLAFTLFGFHSLVQNLAQTITYILIGASSGARRTVQAFFFWKEKRSASDCHDRQTLLASSQALGYVVLATSFGM